jgi:hypothetical protein
MVAAVADIVSAINDFMATPKAVLGVEGQPVWAPGWTEHERVMHYPIEVGGEFRGAQLMVVAFPRAPDLKFRLGILFPAMIARLDFTDETHPNSMGAVMDGLPSFVTGPHYHSWRVNSRFFHGVTKPPKLHNAEPFIEPVHSFDAALRWFCADTNINGLPANHRIELPPRMDLLL